MKQIITHEEIQLFQVTWSLQADLSEYFENDTDFLGATDGFVIGVNYRLRELFSLKSNGTFIIKYSFEIDPSMTNFRFECSNVLFSLSPGPYNYWNMSDKTNIRQFVSVTTGQYEFCFVNDLLVKYDTKRDILYMGSDTDQLDVLDRGLGLTYIFHQLVSVNHYLIMERGMTSSFIWNFDQNPIIRQKVKTELDKRIIKIKYGPDGHLFTLTDQNDLHVWKLEGVDLRFLWTRKSKDDFKDAKFFKMINKDDVLLAFFYRSARAFDIWSVRFNKKIADLTMPEKGIGQIVLTADESMEFSHFVFDDYEFNFF